MTARWVEVIVWTYLVLYAVGMLGTYRTFMLPENRGRLAKLRGGMPTWRWRLLLAAIVLLWFLPACMLSLRDMRDAWRKWRSKDSRSNVSP